MDRLVEITKEEAKKFGMKRYYTGVPCIHGHYAERLVSNRACYKCLSDKRQAHDKANKKAHRARTYRHREKNPDVDVERSSRMRCQSRANRDWQVRDAILVYYWFARYLTRLTKVVHHVDHVWPLNGKNFCGLHRPNNLQVLPRRDNHRKSNKRPETKRLPVQQQLTYGERLQRDDRWPPNQS